MVSLEEEAVSLSRYISEIPSLLAVRLKADCRMIVYAYPLRPVNPDNFINSLAVVVQVVLLDETLAYCISGEYFTNDRKDLVDKLISEFTKLRLAGRL